jgi:hypothetical protein
MIVIPWQRYREHNDRGHDQTADKQNTLSSTIHGPDSHLYACA